MLVLANISVSCTLHDSCTFLYFLCLGFALSLSLSLSLSIIYTYTHTALCSPLTCPLSVWIIDNRVSDLRGSYKNGALRVGASHKRRGAHTPHTDSGANWPLASFRKQRKTERTSKLLIKETDFYARRKERIWEEKRCSGGTFLECWSLSRILPDSWGPSGCTVQTDKAKTHQ